MINNYFSYFFSSYLIIIIIIIIFFLKVVVLSVMRKRRVEKYINKTEGLMVKNVKRKENEEGGNEIKRCEIVCCGQHRFLSHLFPSIQINLDRWNSLLSPLTKSVCVSRSLVSSLSFPASVERCRRSTAFVGNPWVSSATFIFD